MIPKIMGILNVTPDSFSDGGRHTTAADAIAAGIAMHGAGADVIDVGGESTRPGANPVDVEEEWRRVLPVIEGLVARGIPVSIDTLKAEIMRRALQAGATMLNDVSALRFDPEALEVAAASNTQIILSHMAGEPRTMQDAPHYADPLAEVLAHLQERIEKCLARGIARDRLIIDPGIGFGKNLKHNITLLQGLEAFHTLGVPVMLAASRKRMIAAAMGCDLPVDKRLPGSIALALRGAQAGVQWVRVHDVAETRQALLLWDMTGPQLAK
ncbi:MAG: dihydropteroate synthase [Sphingomonadaceae bacterium]